MVNARIERLVVSTPRIGVFDGAGHRTEGNLRLDSERLADPVLGDQSKLERIQVLIVKVRRLNRHFTASARIATTRLVYDVDRRARQRRRDTDCSFLERALTSASHGK
jgi:hypothetical protein